MQSTMHGIQTSLETPLTAKVYQASRNIPRHWQWRLFTLSLVMSDVLMTGLAFRLAYAVRFEFSIPLFRLEVTPSIVYYRNLVFILIPVWLVLFATLGLYNRQDLLSGTREYSQVFNGTTIGMFCVIATGFLLPGFVFARGWLLLAWVFAFLCVASGRFLNRRVVYSLREHGYFLSPAVIVGANDEGISLARQFLGGRRSGLHLLGFVDKKTPEGMPIYGQLVSLGTLNQLDEIVQRYHVEEIILASSAISSRDWLLDIFKRYGVAKGINLRLSSGLYEIITTGLTVKDFAYVPLVGVNQVRMTGVDMILKLALDYSLTIPGILLVLPLLLFIAIAIKLDSPGPIIHRRRVMGVNGCQFDAYKFRTMFINGDALLKDCPDLQEELTTNHKLKDDPRVTRVGRFLRKASLDELPQLFNILKGEMSLVGPRMISPEEIGKYSQWDINLLTVRPGLTGLWQVNGRSDVSYEQRVRFDMHYIRNWSIWLDIQLLFQTLPAWLNRRGAY